MPQSNELPQSAPLAGIRVLELPGQAGALAGRFLADLGADVLLVEPPGGGTLRASGPFVAAEPGVDRGYRHLAYNGGKRSVVADLATAEGQARFRQLASEVDILLESTTPGELAALGLDYDDLKAANPGLIHVSITPHGRHSPWAKRAAADITLAASGGLLYVSGEPERPPVQPVGDLSLQLGSLAAVTGALAALHGRDGAKNGWGAHIDISIQEAVTVSTLQTSNANFWRWYGLAPARNTAREFPVERCADGGYISPRSRPDRWPQIRQWAIDHGIAVRHAPEAWMEANRGNLGSFRTGEAADLVRDLAPGYDRDEFLRLCWSTGVVALPVYSFEEMRESEQLKAIGEFVKFSSALPGRDLESPRSPFAGIRGARPIRRAPALGEHDSDAIHFPSPRLTNAGATGEQPDSLPLKGLRVLDISWVLAGPLGARTLSNLGAEVIKLESGVRMDTIRRSVPSPNGMQLSTGGWFNGANAGKLSATIDTTAEAGRALIARLANECDVVVNNLRPGAIERMGLVYEELRKVNPRIIVVHLPGPGRSGPWAPLASFGNMIAATAGVNALSGFPGTPPTGLGIAFADFAAPYFLASTVLAAVRQRDATGEGQEIEVNQLSGMISLLGAEWMEFDGEGRSPARRANRDANHCPHGAYPARGDDEWLAIAVRGDDQWQTFARTIGSDDLAADPRFATHAARKANEDALDEIVRAWTITQDRWEAADSLQALGIAAAAVESIADQLDRDPCLGTHFQVVHQPAEPDLLITIYGEPIRFDGVDGTLRRAPALGEHNEYVFREIAGLSEEEYVDLVASNVIA